MTRARSDEIDLTQPKGPSLTTGQLARYIGFSGQTIRRDIEAGAIHAYRRQREWRITWSEARRYCEQLGILD